MSQPISDSRRPLPGGGPSDLPGEDRHPFIRAPHQTLFAMSLPLLLSLVAEPLTGLVDTAFVSRLGSADLAAVGVGTTALTSIFWAFSFLGVGTQTDVAKALGRREIGRANQVGTVALLLGLIIGTLLIMVLWPFSSGIVTFMGAAREMHNPAVAYFKIRLLGAPAVLITLAAFGILRGLQDMQSPLKVAVGMNAVNIGLDALLIFGWGPVPGMAVFGPAWTVMCWFQPLNALAFGTDGIHWGTGDFAFLRNVMLLASLSGASALALMPDQASLNLVWLITGGWIAIRAGFGLVRIWPGIGDSPFKPGN